MRLKIVLLSYQSSSPRLAATLSSYHNMKTSSNRNTPLNLKSLNSNRNYKTSCSEYTATHNNIETLDYDFDDANSTNTVLQLKMNIANKMNVTPDTLRLFLYKENKYIELNDMSKVTSIVKDSTKFLVLYYQLCYNKIKLKIEINQKSIQQVNIKIANSCQLYMLKHIINEKVKNILPVNLQKIFGIKLVSYTQKRVLSDNGNNKEFDNENTISDIIQYYVNKEDIILNHNEDIVLFLLLMIQDNNKTKIGLNFAFNCFNNVSKINYDDSAPNYRECSDGLNLICYCKNEKCKIYNEMFISVLGYGKFNIIDIEIFNLKCPVCFSNFKHIDLRNIGLINSKWTFKSRLKTKNCKVLTNEGQTLDEKMHILKEINFRNMIDYFKIEVLPLFHSEPNNEKESLNSSSLENIDIYIKAETNKTNRMNNLKLFLDSKKNKIVSYDEDRSFDADVINFDEKDEGLCEGCFIGNCQQKKNNENCIIF